MSDGTNSPDQAEGFPLKEKGGDAVAENLNLLTLQLIGRGDKELNELTRRNLHAVRVGETRVEDGKTIASIKVEYDTDSGRINLASGSFEYGERSRLHTYLVTSGRQIVYDQAQGRWVTKDVGMNTILLYQPGDMPTVEQYTSVIAGDDTPPPEDRRILPERIIPEHPDLIGEHEPWGQSRYTANADGDLVMLKTIQQFNAKFGPSK